MWLPVWAWRPGRVHTVKSVDHLLTILPFEKKIFEKYEVPTTFVGHPITEINIENFKKNQITEGDREVFLILPGSRKRKFYLFTNLLRSNKGHEVR